MTPRLQPWDFAGGLVILNEVDGQASNLLGEPLTIGGPNSVLVGNRGVHRDPRCIFRATSRCVNTIT